MGGFLVSSILRRCGFRTARIFFGGMKRLFPLTVSSGYEEFVQSMLNAGGVAANS
jgi:hypothetical protein